MPLCRFKLIGLGLSLSGCLCAVNLAACNVPVFRYALERWTPDPYVFVVFREQGISQDSQAALGRLQKAVETGSANLLVRESAISGSLPAAFRALWEEQAKPSLPWMVVRYPSQTGIKRSVWAGSLDTAGVANLLNSPAREEVASKLMAGDSAVWLLLESDDKGQNDALANVLRTESEKLSKTLELPTLGPDDPEIAAGLPLRVAFSTVRVSRVNPAEAMLVRQLLSWHPDLAHESGPILFPVFGRGRVLPPAIGQGITPVVIETMARLLTGPCSCQIKEMNAGFDLLMAIDWSKAFQHSNGPPREGPPLVGLSQFAHDGTNAPGTLPSYGSPARPVSAAAIQSPLAGDHLVRNLVLVTSLALLFLGITTILLRAKPERAPD